MAFIAQNLSLIVQPVGAVGLRMFSYKTDDSRATLEVADYIPKASVYGLREDDLIFVSQISGGAEPYIMVVGDIDVLDNATLVFGDSLLTTQYPTTRVLLAALDTTYNTIAYLAESGREGYFKRVLAADYTAEIAADTEQGIFVASTHNVLYAWMRVDAKRADITHFGAVADGTIDVNDYSGRPSYDDIAAVEAATITGDPEIILVKGMPYRIVDEDHQKLGANRITGNPTAGTGWSIVGDTATAVAGTASSLTWDGMLPPDGTSVLVEFEATQSAGSMSVLLGTGGSAMTGVGATVTYRHIGSCGTGKDFFLSKSSAFAGTVDLSTVSIRPIFGVISSANGKFYAPVNPLFMPFGTGDVTGTDNRDAIQCAINVAELMGIPVYVPPGKFKVDIGERYREVVLAVGKRFEMIGEEGQSWLIANDDKDWLGPTIGAFPTFPQTGNVFIGSDRFYETAFSTATPENFNLDINEYFIMRGVGVQSTWWRDIEKRQRAWLNPTPVGASGPYRCQILAPVNTSYVLLDNCKIWDVMGTAVYACSNREVNYFNCDVRRINGNGLRSENATITRMHHNMVLHCDDDSVSITDQDDRPNSYGPREHFASFCDNIIIASEGPLMMGTFDLTMTGNKLFLCYGTGLALFNMPVEGPGQGGGGTAITIIKDNVVLNQMQANDRQIIPDGSWEPSECSAVLLRGAIGAAVSTTLPLGTGSATPITFPWDSGDYPWGGAHLFDTVGDGTGAQEFPATGNVGDSTASGYMGFGLIYGDNIIGRTLPEALAYADWGFGRRHTRYGTDNPEVLDTNFAETGIEISGSWDGALIGVGEVFGFIDGPAIDISLEKSYGATFKNVTIHGGHITNCKHGIGILRSNEITDVETVDIRILDVKINLDPFRYQASRGADNTWATSAFGSNYDTTDPTGIMAPYMRGLIIDGCVFENMSVMWSLEGGLVGSPSYSTVRNNLGIIDPVTSLGASEFSTSNKGIGRIYPAGKEITYQIRELTPARDVTVSATVTISNASPAVVTWTSHGRSVGAPVIFTTDGALPTGLTAGAVYYVETVLSANTFNVAATAGGAAVNTSSAGSGTHTATAQRTFGNAKEGMRSQGTALPSSGYYVTGHVFTNISNGKRYLRLLSGTAHVLGTDWIELGSASFKTISTYETIATDAGATLVVGTNGNTIRHTGTLTADRTLSLSTSGATVDSSFRITRTGTGDFNLSIGGLINLATNTWADVRFNGSAWYLAEYGSLTGGQRMTTIATDLALVFTVGSTAPVIRHTGTLTADRAITLSTTGATTDSAFRITRTGAGAFNLSVGGLKNLATNSWCVVRYDGSAWYLAEYGTL